MINRNQISSKLDEIPIEELSYETEFVKYADHAITARSFLMSFFMMIANNENSLRQWAVELSKVIQSVFSKSAISQKLQYRHLAFAQQLLKHVLRKQVYQSSIEGLKSSLFTSFSNVFIEDSMCLKLPANLAGVYPGAHSTTGQASTARVQCRVELKSGRTTHIEVQSFRDNDQKFASHILHSLKAGDLVIRDLGYCVLWVFRLIHWMDAYFLSRYRFNTNIYDPINGDQLDLIQLFRKASKNKESVIQRDVLLGSKEKLPLRLVAIKVPDNVAQQRRRKASKDRNKKANHSKEYMEFLGWTVFITNVEQALWTPQQMLKVYGFRWRIEIIFKCWKSKFNFARLFHKKQSLTPPRATISLYFLLVWITLFFVRLFNFFFNEIYRRKQCFVSLLKFAKFFKDHFVQLINCPDWDFFIALAAQHCVYEKRKKIPNFYESLYLLNFTAR